MCVQSKFSSTALIVFAVALCMLLACPRKPETRPTVSLPESQTPAATPTVEPNGAVEALEDEDDPVKLQYKGFTIEKKAVVKTDGNDNPKTEIFDVVISKNGRRVKTIEGDYNPMGNSMSIELISLLGGNEKQLIASASANRDARSRVVSLDKGVEILFDTREWGISRSGVEPVDLDGDGVFELISWIRESRFGAAYGLSANNKLIFKFDAKARRFLPANHLFPDECLKDLPDAMAKYRRGDNEPQGFDEVMMIFLYAGKEAEAWKFFDENATYGTVPSNKSEGKEEIRRGFLDLLKTDRFYQYVKKASKISRNK